MNIKMIMQMVLRYLGIKAFSKNPTGQLTLQEAEKEKIAKTFGEKFANVFEKGLSEFKESDAVANSASAQDPGGADLGAELMTALREGQDAKLEEQMAAVMKTVERLEGQNASLQTLVDALSGKDEDEPIAQITEFKGKEGVPTVMKVNMSKPYYAAYKSFMETGSASSYANATIEVGDLKSEFGTYLNTQRNLEILSQIFVGFTSSKYFTTKLAVTEWQASEDLITSVVQQFTSEWSEAGKVKFTPIVIKNRRHKINVPIKPADVLDSYIFYLYDEQLSPDQMPITKYIIEKKIKPKILQDIELRMICKGKFKATTNPNVATPPEDAMDGLEVILVEAKADNSEKNIQFYPGAVGFDFKTASNQEILDHVEGFVDWITPIYATTEMNIFCSREFYKKYKRAYKKVWGSGSGQDGDFGKDKVDFSNNTLVILDGMYGSPILFATPQENMIKLRYKNEAPNIINDIQKADYKVKVFGEFWLGVGFAIGEGVFAYVPNGYDPKAKIKAVHGDADKFPGEEEESGA